MGVFFVLVLVLILVVAQFEHGALDGGLGLGVEIQLLVLDVDHVVGNVRVAAHDLVEQLRVSFLALDQILVELGVLAEVHEFKVDYAPALLAMV